MGFQEDLIKSLEEKRRFEEELKMANKKIKLLNMKLDRFAELKKENEEWKEVMRISNRELENRIMVLTNENKVLKDSVQFNKQKYDMAIRTPTPTADLEGEIRQLENKVVLWKKDAEKSKEEAQKFREQYIKEVNMKEKYRNELNIMKAFYEVEKERAKKVEEDCQKLLEELKKEKENSEYFSDKVTKANKVIREMGKEIQKVSEESNKWKETYKDQLKNLAASSAYPLKSFIHSALKSALEIDEGMAQLNAIDINKDQIVTGTLEVAEEFKLSEVFAVMKHNAEDPELYNNPTEAIQRTEQLNQEKDAYNIRTVRILKVK